MMTNPPRAPLPTLVSLVPPPRTHVRSELPPIPDMVEDTTAMLITATPEEEEEAKAESEQAKEDNEAVLNEEGKTGET